MSRTKIPWAKYSINPLRVQGGGFHCTKVSAGCQNCYAERMNLHRFRGLPYDNRKVEWKVDLSCFDTLPKRGGGIVFLQSMSDLFHFDVPLPLRFEIIKKAGQLGNHIFVILTKRPGLARYHFGEQNLPDNLWLGVSVEDQQTADERIPKLLQIPAAKRLVSYEPALGELNIEPYLQYPPLHEKYKLTLGMDEWWGIDWVIAGCESGTGRRLAEIDWFRSVRDQCLDAGVPYFLKQMQINGKVVEMPLLDGIREQALYY